MKGLFVIRSAVPVTVCAFYIMNKSIVFLFPGQGSQYYHMARELFARHPVFTKYMLELDGLARSIGAISVLDHIYDDRKTPANPFDRVAYTHPAIFMIEYSLSQAVIESGIAPDYVLGTSLGEFAAAAVAGVMSAGQLMEMLLKQAEYFEACCRPAGMLAIINDVRVYHETRLIRDNTELASVNYDSHFVISGKQEHLSEIDRLLKQRGILCQSLPVTYGFHSSFIDPAAAAFKEYLNGKTCRAPRVPFMSGLYGTSLKDLSPEYFWDVVRQPAQFPKAIEELERSGARMYIDLGPAGTLTNFAKRNINASSKSETHAIVTPFHQELRNLEKIRKLVSAETVFTR